MFHNLVYDQIIPIVDYTNLLIMGVTVALAWRLPDTPDFREKTVSEENRKIFQINRKQDNGTAATMTGQHHPYFVYSDRKHYHDHRINLEYQNYLIEKSKQQQNHSTYNWNNAKWYSVVDKDKSRFKHRIYPVLLKRRAIKLPKNKRDEMCLHAQLKSHTQHHRHTRFSFYHSIEKYLNAWVECVSPKSLDIQNNFVAFSPFRRGHSGQQCIQLAICETAQRSRMASKRGSSDGDPQSFLKEIMRAIFR